MMCSLVQSKRNVTIVIPVYKDWDTLNACLESLKKYVSPKNRVLLVNDMSSEWKGMEDNILQSVQGLEYFKYARNERNLGFVKTCNRAVFELDDTDNDILLLNSDTEVTEGFLEELQNVLYITEKHGAVCPRSNHATIYTIPVRNMLVGKECTPEVSYSVFRQMKSKMPRYSIMPTGVGFCLLIKRELIKKYGLFDEIYGMGYNEENDFCIRINQYGYNVVSANRAYVFHHESKSFGDDRRRELDAKNSKTLLERYPYYRDMVCNYIDHEMAVADVFADLIAEGVYEKKRILFSLMEIPASFNGTARYGLAIFGAFYDLFSDKYDIHLLINKDADEFYGMMSKYPNVHHPDDIDETFHLAFSPSQIFSMEHLSILNRVALKFVFCMQDIISIRSGYLLTQDYGRYDIFRRSIEYCDGMTSISFFSLQDTMSYFHNVFEDRDILLRVIYHGMESQIGEISKEKLPLGKFFLVYGNFYKHKYLAETITTLKNSPHFFIVLGAENTGWMDEGQHIYGYKSGELPDAFINKLATEAIGLLFPSVYEGFGLPILDGIKFDKKIIVTDNELNRELKQYFRNYSENILLFADADELEEKLRQIEQNPIVSYVNGKKVIRTWKDVAEELEEFLENVLNRDMDMALLHKRWRDIRYADSVRRMAIPQPEYDFKTVWQRKVFDFKTRLLQNHPKFFYFLHHMKRDVMKVKD